MNRLSKLAMAASYELRARMAVKFGNILCMTLDLNLTFMLSIMISITTEGLQL